MALTRWVVSLLAGAVVGLGMAGAARGDVEGRYEAGAAKFVKGDLAGAGRELAGLAPFEGADGGRALYLLGRVHQLGGESPEAMADYKRVLGWWEGKKGVGGKRPEYVDRAGFYLGVLLGESGRGKEAMERLKPFEDGKTGLGAEAVLRVGLLQLQGKEYGAAIETLRPLLEDARFGDQALWFTGRAQIAGAVGAEREKGIRSGIESLKLAAGRAKEMGKRDGEALVRWADEMLEVGDGEMMVKDFAGAAGTYGEVEKTKDERRKTKEEMEERRQEGMAREVGALELAGRFLECEALAGAFEREWVDSVLLGGVRFREAESVYLRGCAAGGDRGLLEEACGKLAKMVRDYPEYVYVSEARMDWGTALYRMEKYAEAAEVLQGIPGSDRNGELATVSLMQGDCLLRTLPVAGDDALSAARMLMQAERAAAELSGFVLANPGHAQTPTAQYKLGYCYQKMGAALAQDGGERWKMWQQARDAYGAMLAAVPADSALAAEGTFERGRVLAAMGDVAGAVGELRKFQSDPMAKAACAPLGLLRLAMVLRIQQGKGLEGAEILGKRLAADKGMGERVRGMMMYEQGVGVKEGGKPAEARAIFEKVAKEFGGTVEGADSLWRMAQEDREAIAGRLTEARRRMAAVKKPAEREAAVKELVAATGAMRDWAAGTKGVAEGARQVGGEGAVRLMYELAWGYRAIGDAEAELEKRNPGIAIPGLGEADGLARGAFGAAIEMGDRGGEVEQEVANLARQDWAEMLAQRGRVDEAMDMFTEVLEHGAGAREAQKPRLRIAECLLAKGDAEGALAQVGMMLRPGWRMGPDARYVAAEAYAALKRPKQVMDTLLIFEDEAYWGGEFGDRALMRLGEGLLKARKVGEARSVFALLVKRYPGSGEVAEARMRLGVCQLMVESW